MASQELGLVSLRVPPPGEDADTVIRELVERAPRPAELDRRDLRQGLLLVRQDAGRVGAARARVERSRAPRAAARAWRELRSDKPDREDDVEGWLKKFGGSE